ncbi:MAG TPA: SDR family oxidoreductase [Anaerolineae bacterium]|nr:SDR family oxidoreductase [Anaerolineae bacterium]
MSNKHILITGATSGIGLASAVALAKTKATIIIIGRSPSKCQTAVTHIKQQSNNQNVQYLVADLSNINATRAIANVYQEKFNRLDVLINNAGGLFKERRLSADGYEMNVALNHIGPFVLTNQLRPLLLKTAQANPSFGARVINVSSDAHRLGIDWDNLMSEKSYSQLSAYGQSKTMLNMFTFELARRLAGTGVTVNALHPGAVQTDIAKKDGNSLLSLIFAFLGRLFFRTPEKGANTTVYLATSPAVAGVTGKYFVDEKIKEVHPSNQNPQDWVNLWTKTEIWVATAKN